MSLKTITRWRCDKCNISTQEPGKDALIPEGWGHVTITVRVPCSPETMRYFEALGSQPGIVHVDTSGDTTIEQSETKHYCKDCWHDDISPVL